MELSIIIVSYNTKDILYKCLSLVKLYINQDNTEVIIVDNASKDNSAEMVSENFPQFQLIRSKTNIGFAAGNNLALKIAKGEFFLLLNPDAYISKSNIPDTITFMKQNPKCGILGVQLIGENGSWQPSARDLPGFWSKTLVISGISKKFPNSRLLGGPDRTWWDHKTASQVGWVVGAYFLMRKELIKDLGYLDERYFVYFEELDYCLNAQKSGWQVIYNPDVNVIHVGGGSATIGEHTVSRTGSQVLKFRIESEMKYYFKNYSFIKMYLIIKLEYIWMLAIILKNTIFRNIDSQIKIENAKYIIDLINKSFQNKIYKNQ